LIRIAVMWRSDLVVEKMLVEAEAERASRISSSTSPSISA